MSRYGLIIDQQTPEDYVFGASILPRKALVENGDWTIYLPQKEYQNLGAFEPSACVSFTVLNCLEALIIREYSVELNLSDRFLASASGTTQAGNSPRTVCDTLRKKGVVKQELWPFDESITSFEDYYKKIPAKLFDTAKDFIEEWDFRYEDVPQNHFEIAKALKTSPLMISVAAWHVDNDGVYYRPEGYTDNHATTLIKESAGKHRTVFDTYGPDQKNYRYSDMPQVIKRFYIEKRKKPLTRKSLLGCLKSLFT